MQQPGSLPIQGNAAPDGAVLSCPAGQKAVGAACQACDKGYWCQGGIAQKCETNYWNNVTNAANSTDGCLPCPVPGTECVLGNTITVRPGWYVYGASEATGYKCAISEACVGGDWKFGNSNCAIGYEGILCGKCQQGYYRLQRKCASCKDVLEAQAKDGSRGNASLNTILLFGLGGSSVFFLLFLYLLPTSFRFDAPRSRFGKGVSSFASSTLMKLISRRIRIALPIFSGLAKVILSYTQCIGALNRFALVKWPRLFIEFMEKLDVLVPEFLSVVPAECIAATRFGFYLEFLATLLMPLLLMLFIVFVLVVVRVVGILLKWPRAGASDPGKKVEGPYDPHERLALEPSEEASDTPPETQGLRGFVRALQHQNVYHLMIMAMLVMYPAIARKTMFMFDCMDGGYAPDGTEIRLLRDDPATLCGDAEWNRWMPLAIASIIVYCLGVPVAFFILAYKYHKVAQAKLYAVHKPSDLVWLDRLSLLVSTYEPKYWYCESVWMLHRLFFTGVVLILQPESRTQIWFGSVVCLFFYVGFMLTRPFVYDIVDIVQAGCLLQLLLTYLTAFVFLDDGNAEMRAELDDNPMLGIALVAINCIAFIILFASMTIETIRTRQVARSRRLRFVENGGFVTPSDFQYALTAPGSMLNTKLPFAPLKFRKDDKGQVLSYHIFLSHSWRTGQDAMRITKERLIEMVPGMFVFLDVDDLREGKGAESVDVSCVILVFCTQGYFNSSNCMRELLRAVAIKKPILTVLEPDEAKGRLTRSQIHAQLKEADRYYRRWGLTDEVRTWVEEGICSEDFFQLFVREEGAHQVLYDALFPADMQPVEWDRIAAFQNVSLCNMAATLLKPTQLVYLHTNGVTTKPKIPKPRNDCRFHLFCSANNPGAEDFFSALQARQTGLQKGGRDAKRNVAFDAASPNPSDWASLPPVKSSKKGGAVRTGKDALAATSNPTELRFCERMLLYLTARTWTGPRERVDALAKEVASAMALGVEIFMVHEAPGDDSCSNELGEEMVAADLASKRCACEFGLFFQYTPAPLLKANLYSAISKVAKGGRLRDASMRILIHSLADFPLRKPVVIVQGIGLDASVVPGLPELPPDDSLLLLDDPPMLPPLSMADAQALETQEITVMEAPSPALGPVENETAVKDPIAGATVASEQPETQQSSEDAVSRLMNKALMTHLFSAPARRAGNHQMNTTLALSDRSQPGGVSSDDAFQPALSV